jgi:CubicO group peptidase (beta-lactamase class C family)
MRTRRLPSTPLADLHEAVTTFVASGEVPGAVTLIGRDGEPHLRAVGVGAKGGAPMGPDTIVRLSSLTKPIAAAAAMMLVDEGVLHLDDKVERWLPELGHRRVLRRLESPLDDTEPARRPITVRDVLTYRMGCGALLRKPDSTPIQRAMSALELRSPGPPKPATPHPPDEWMRRLGSLPWMSHPGEAWQYDTPGHVLGVLLARAAGASLDTLLRDRLFNPLGMKDTGFVVPDESLARFSACYAPANTTPGRLVVHDGVDDSQWRRPPIFPDASGGLVSTARDYWVFAEMLRSGGRHGRTQILTREAVDGMTMNHLSTRQMSAAGAFLDGGRGWGFGLSVIPGRGFGWDGGYGTSWASNAAAGVTAILITQRLVFPASSGVEAAFWRHVDAIVHALDR